MKWIISLFMPAMLASCNQPFKKQNGRQYSSPEQYNNYIIDRQKEVVQYVTSFYDLLPKNIDSARIVLANGLNRTGEALEEIKKMPPYHSDTSFRAAAIQSFTFYKRLFAEEYPVILTMHSKPGGITIEDEEEQQRIIDKIMKDEERCDKDMHNRQKDFADRYHMRLSSEE